MMEPGREESVASVASICDVSKEPGQSVIQSPANQRESYRALATAFVVLFCIVGVALWGLPFYYDFMVQQFGWTRAQVTSGNALSKLIVGPIFGFLAGWVVDRFGPRRLMMIGILMAGVALVGLGSIGSTGHAERRWASPTSESASEGQPSRGYRMCLFNVSDGRPLCKFWASPS
jgi:MFS family permease